MNIHADSGESSRSARAATIARLNDTLRRTGQGGRCVVTAGVAALPPPVLQAVLAAVAAFDAWDGDNDPYDEHDLGLIEVTGQRVFFKIEYYDLGLRYLSPDPADPAVTQRVMTIMLADEL